MSESRQSVRSAELTKATQTCYLGLGLVGDEPESTSMRSHMRSEGQSGKGKIT